MQEKIIDEFLKLIYHKFENQQFDRFWLLLKYKLKSYVFNLIDCGCFIALQPKIINRSELSFQQMIRLFTNILQQGDYFITLVLCTKLKILMSLDQKKILKMKKYYLKKFEWVIKTPNLQRNVETCQLLVNLKQQMQFLTSEHLSFYFKWIEKFPPNVEIDEYSQSIQKFNNVFKIKAKKLKINLLSEHKQMKKEDYLRLNIKLILDWLNEEFSCNNSFQASHIIIFSLSKIESRIIAILITQFLERKFHDNSNKNQVIFFRIINEILITGCGFIKEQITYILLPNIFPKFFQNKEEILEENILHNFYIFKVITNQNYHDCRIVPIMYQLIEAKGILQSKKIKSIKRQVENLYKKQLNKIQKLQKISVACRQIEQQAIKRIQSFKKKQNQNETQENLLEQFYIEKLNNSNPYLKNLIESQNKSIHLKSVQVSENISQRQVFELKSQEVKTNELQTSLIINYINHFNEFDNENTKYISFLNTSQKISSYPFKKKSDLSENQRQRYCKKEISPQKQIQIKLLPFNFQQKKKMFKKRGLIILNKQFQLAFVIQSNCKVCFYLTFFQEFIKAQMFITQKCVQFKEQFEVSEVQPQIKKQYKYETEVKQISSHYKKENNYKVNKVNLFLEWKGFKGIETQKYDQELPIFTISFCQFIRATSEDKEKQYKKASLCSEWIISCCQLLKNKKQFYKQTFRIYEIDEKGNILLKILLKEKYYFVKIIQIVNKVKVEIMNQPQFFILRQVVQVVAGSN